jgi:hypothetical protein
MKFRRCNSLASTRMYWASTVAVLSLLVGCTTTRADSDYVDKHAAWQARLSAALSAQGDADSLVALALLRRSVTEPRDQPDATALDALNAAAAAAPERPVVAALRLQACLAAPACDATEAVAHVRRIDPRNGIADWPRLRAAMRNSDAAEIDAALASLAEAQYFNIYFNGYVVAAVDALTRTHLPAAPQLHRKGAATEWVFVAIDGSTMYSTVPALEIAEACGDPGASATRHMNCLQMYATLMRSDTMGLQSLGANSSLWLSPHGSPQANAASALKRNLDWYDEGLRSAMTPWNLRRLPGEVLAALRAHAREEDARRAVLTALKVSPSAPADWKPPTEPVAARD